MESPTIAPLAGGLPGEDLVGAGLAALQRDELTIESLLVSIGAPRLRQLGLEVVRTFSEPEDRLFELLESQGEDALGRYNALVRRLVSFERAVECLA